jgi:hypothetical protein
LYPRVRSVVFLPIKTAQCAAVSTLSSSIRVPPQKYSLYGGLSLVSAWMDVMNGYLPSGTGVPPTTWVPTFPSPSCASTGRAAPRPITTAMATAAIRYRPRHRTLFSN